MVTLTWHNKSRIRCFGLFWGGVGFFMILTFHSKTNRNFDVVLLFEPISWNGSVSSSVLSENAIFQLLEKTWTKSFCFIPCFWLTILFWMCSMFHKLAFIWYFVWKFMCLLVLWKCNIFRSLLYNVNSFENKHV